MAFVQAIDLARAERVGPEGIDQKTLTDTLRCPQDGPAWLPPTHADRGLPLLRRPAEAGDLETIRSAAARLRHGATDVVLMGTGGSSLGGQTVAQLADHAVAGAGALRAAPRLH